MLPPVGHSPFNSSPLSTRYPNSAGCVPLRDDNVKSDFLKRQNPPCRNTTVRLKLSFCSTSNSATLTVRDARDEISEGSEGRSPASTFWRLDFSVAFDSSNSSWLCTQRQAFWGWRPFQKQTGPSVRVPTARLRVTELFRFEN